MTSIRYTRTGKELLLHPKMASSLSPVLLDCEIWYKISKRIIILLSYYILLQLTDHNRFGRGLFSLSGVLVKFFLEYVQWDLLR